MRRATWSARDFEGLPVLPYDGAAELGARIRELAGSNVPFDELRRRFGPDQALDAILGGGSRQ